jgi:hypothetical protein
MHINNKDGSSSNKNKYLALKANHEKEGKAKVKEDSESSSNEEVDDLKLALILNKTTKMLNKLNREGIKFY